MTLGSIQEAYRFTAKKMVCRDVDLMCPQQKSRRKADLFSVCSTLSLARDYRARAEAVVYTQLDGMLVIPETGADDRSGAAGEGGVAENVI